ncbi:MAG: hypothetical protein HC868_02580 [Sphingomonadales bacterium]|nr:hypothetical protein [Sphingomonadales bacterium]
MKTRNALGLVSVAALSLTALLPFAASSIAGDSNGYVWHYRPHNKSVYQPHRPRYDRVYSYRRRHNHDHDRDRDYVDDKFDRDRECKPPLARTGGEAFDEDNAKQRADLAWQEEVRFLWGERYMDVANAQRARYECSRSSTNESWIGKAGERIAGDAAVKKRCRITALPCRGERDKADKRDR